MKGSYKSATQATSVMSAFAIGLVSLAIASVMGIAVLVGFKNSGTMDATGNTTIDYFIVAIGIFGTFASVMALVLIGKIVLGLVKN